jgi:hypothetical protein
MRVLFPEINLPVESDRLELARRVLEPRLKVQLPIASGRVSLGATIALSLILPFEAIPTLDACS